jgi:parallel beta-helix repeat protein
MRFVLWASLAVLLPMFAFSADCSEIGTNGTIYSSTTLTQDLTASGDCLIIGRDNVTLDCAGHSLAGSGGGTGIYVMGRRGAEVKDCRISNFNYGLYASYSESSFFSGNKITRSYIGIIVSSSSSLVFEKNSADGNGEGVYAYGLQGSTFALGSARNNKGHGLSMKSSIENKVRGNDFSGNAIGIELNGSSDAEITGNDLRSCYIGYKESGTRGAKLSDNAQDILSGSGWEALFKDIRTVVAMVFVILVIGAAVFVIGIGRPKKHDKEGIQLDKVDMRDMERTRNREREKA